MPMLTPHGFSYWAVLGAADLETRYATILVVLATAVMICYAFFMTISHRNRPIPRWSSLFPARKPLQATHGTHEPLPGKGVSINFFPYTYSGDLALADEPDSAPGFEVIADPILEPRASLVESEPLEVADCLPPSPPFSGLEAQPESETNASGPEGRDGEESLVPEPSRTDDIVADFPLAAHPEIATSPDTEEEPRVVEIREMACATSERASGNSDDARPSIESAESLVTVSISSPLAHTLELADGDASMLIETPFLLSVENGSSEDDEATLDAGRLTEEDTITGSAVVQSPCSQPDSLHGEVSSNTMPYALLAHAKRVVDEGASSTGAVVGLEIDDDDWTSVDPDEPSSPVGPQSGMAEGTSTIRTGEDDLASSAVLLTQSQYASVILTPNAVNDRSLSSPTSSVSPRSVHPRVHTEDRPDWAVAPQERERQEDDTTRERMRRRHSVESPDWAVAPEDTSGGGRMKKSDPGSGRRKKPRRAWASR